MGHTGNVWIWIGFIFDWSFADIHTQHAAVFHVQFIGSVPTALNYVYLSTTKYYIRSSASLALKGLLATNYWPQTAAAVHPHTIFEMWL